MQKKAFSLVLTLVLAFMGLARAEVVTIGEGTSSYYYTPVNMYFNFSFSEQIYTPEEIGTAGTISSIGFYYNYGSAFSMDNITLYMKNTSKTEFANTNDMEAMTLDDIVWTGTFAANAAGWVTITLDTPFEYDGESNLMVAMFDGTSGYPGSSFTFRTTPYDTNNGYKALCWYSDNSNYLPDPYAPASSYSGSTYRMGFRNNIQLDITPAAGQADLHIYYVDGETQVDDQLNLGTWPVGAWMQPFEFKMRNDGFTTTVTVLDFTPSDGMFTVGGQELPFELRRNSEVDLNVSVNATEAGIIERQFVAITENSRTAFVWPITVEAYTPECPDVVEVAYDLGTLNAGYSYVGIPADITPTTLHNDYTLPFPEIEEGVDAVYKFTVANDMVLNALVSQGENGKVALYKQNGTDPVHPMADNNYTGPVVNGGRTQFVYDFEGGLNGWTTIDNDGDGHDWFYSMDHGWYNYAGYGNGDSDGFAVSASYYDGTWEAYHADNCLVSPQKYAIESGNSMSFYYEYAAYGYSDYFEVCVATVDNPTAADFTAVWNSDRTYPSQRSQQQRYDSNRNRDWTEVTVDLSEYAGQNVWIAFHHQDYDEYEVWIDDVTINAADGTPGELGEISYGPEIANAAIEAGTYYLVASSTSPDFEVTIGTVEMPCPEVEGFAFNPQPADDADGLEPASVTLHWSIPAYATEWRLVFGSTYYPEPNHPQTIITDWSNELANSYTVTNLWNNTNYFWHVEFRNGNCAAGVSSPIWGFTTSLNKPHNLTAEDYTVFNDDSIVLHWTVVVDRTYRTYNVYRNGELIGNTEMNNINDSTYVDGPLDYNMGGYTYYVTAVYDEGESAPSNTITVQVSGYGEVNGHVWEQDGETPIAGAIVRMEGQDEFGDNQVYNFTTDSTGYYTGHVYAGSYNGSASMEGYQTIDHPVQGNPIAINYDETTSPIDYMLDENFIGPCSVIAEYYPDSLDPTSPYVKVYWGCGLPGEGDEFSFGFEEELEPNGWSIQSHDATTWVREQTTQFGAVPHEGQWQMWLHWSYYDQDEWLKTPEFTVPTGGNLNFWHYIHEGSTNGDHYYVKISTDGGNTWTALWDASALPSADNYYNHAIDIDLSEYAGQRAMLAWHGYAIGGLWYAWCVDDITVSGGREVISFNGKRWFRRPVHATQPQGHLNYSKAGDVEPMGTRGSNRSLSHYRVYRTNCYNDGPYTAENTVLLSTVWVPDTVYIDVEWADLEPGIYKWGVGAVYEGNRGELTESEISWTEPVNVNKANAPRRRNVSKAMKAYEGTSVIANNRLAFGTRGRDLRGNMGYGSVVYSSNANIPVGYDKFDLDDFTSATVLSSSIGSLRGATYMPETGHIYASTGDGYFVEIDPENGNVLNQNMGTFAYLGLAYDANTGTMYCMDSYGYLGTVDPATGVMTDIGPSNEDFLSMTGDINGNLYGITMGTPAQLYSIDKNSGNYTLIGSTGMNANYAQSFEFDNSNGRLYWCQFYNGVSSFCEIDPATGVASVLADNIGEVTGFAIPYENETPAPTPTNLNELALPRESETIWSNCLEKGMILGDGEVDITVLLNSADSPEGVRVNFTNLNPYEQELHPMESVILDETGFYSWESFRKGDYAVRIENDGYYAIEDTVSIWEPSHLRYVMVEILYGINDLYVSRTGWAMWGNLALPTPTPSGDTEFTDDFEDNLDNWTIIDADGDGHTWLHSSQSQEHSCYDYTGYGHNGSTAFAYSQSYTDCDYSVYSPDNFMVTAQKYAITETSVLNFWADYGNDSYPDHFGVGIATVDNPTAADFTMVWEGQAKGNGAKASVRGGENRMGNWREHTIDLSAYAGQEVYIAFRHFNCSDEYEIYIDDVTLTAGRNEGDRHFEYYKVMCESLDHEPIFNTNTTHPFCQVNTDELVEGELYLCKVAAMYSTGMSEWTECIWEYESCEHYEGTVNGVTVSGNTISWEYPEGRSTGNREGQWYHYDNGTYFNALGLSDNSTGEVFPFEWGIMFPTGSYTGNSLTKVSYYDKAANTGTIEIFQGGDTAPTTMIYSQAYSTTGVEDFVEFTLDQAVTLDPAQNLWVVFNTDGGFVAALDNQPANANGMWLYSNLISDDWQTMVQATGGSFNGNWMIRAYIEEGGAPVPPTPGETNCIGAMIFADGEWVAFVEAPTNSYVYEGNAEEVCVRMVYDGTAELPSGNYYYAMSCPECEPFRTCESDIQFHGEIVNDNQAKIWWGEPQGEAGWITYCPEDLGENIAAVGAGIGIPIEWGAMFPAESLTDYVGSRLTKVGYLEVDEAIFLGENILHGTMEARIYVGANAPETLLSTTSFYVAADTDQILTIDLDTPVRIEEGQNLWIMFYHDGSTADAPAVAIADVANTPNNRWLLLEGSLIDLAQVGGAGWMWFVAGYIDNGAKGGELISNVDNTHTTVANGINRDFNLVMNTAHIDGGFHFNRYDSNAVAYNIYRSADNVDYELIATLDYVEGQTYYEYIDTPNSGNYYYQVRTVYEDGCISEPALNADNNDLNYVYLVMDAVDENRDDVTLYPNPTKGNVTIQANDMSHITVVSVLGQVVFDTDVKADEYVLNMAQFNSGMYVVRIATEKGVVTKRVTVMQ